MWFKRRKKTEQNQALSQSLRSLQSLLNDSDRREPSLESPHSETFTETSDEPGTPRVPRVPGKPTAPSLSDRDPERNPVLKEPPPPDSASRWRDLSLTFDAEPATPPRSRPGPDEDTGEQTEGDDDGIIDNQSSEAAGPDSARIEDEEAPESEPETIDDEEIEPAAQAGDDAPIEAVSIGTPADEPTPHNDTAREMEHGTDDTPGSEDAATNDSDTAAETGLITDMTVVDFEAFSEAPGGTQATVPPAADGPGGETVELRAPESAGGDADQPAAASNDTGEPEWEAPAPAAGVETHGNPDQQVDTNERAEDQLPLELEPIDEESEEAIPTLTEAIYVPPDESPDEPAVELTWADTDELPADDNVARVIEQLRTRLQLMELDELSPEQEAQLRDTLEELMDDLRGDTASL